MSCGRYVSLAGLGRLHLLVRSALFRKALKRHWYPMVGAAMIRYRREIPSMRKFTLRTRILGWGEKWFRFEHRFELGETLAANVPLPLLLDPISAQTTNVQVNLSLRIREISG